MLLTFAPKNLTPPPVPHPAFGAGERTGETPVLRHDDVAQAFPQYAHTLAHTQLDGLSFGL
jgi:hypothetical protein